MGRRLLGELTKYKSGAEKIKEVKILDCQPFKNDSYDEMSYGIQLQNELILVVRGCNFHYILKQCH